MPYTKLLNRLIDDSGYSIKEIAERCTENGVKVTPAYISTLRNDTNNRTPSDNMSRALAKACNAKSEDILVVEAYVDNAPKEFAGLINLIRQTMVTSVIGSFANSFPKEQVEEIRKQFETMPVSDLIIALNESNQDSITKDIGAMNITQTGESSGYSVTTQLKNAFGIEISDDSMFPTMPKGSKAVIEIKEPKDYRDGDILAFAEKAKKEVILFRKIVFLNEDKTQIAMIAINTDFETKTYNTNDIIVLGKVNQIIIDIK